MAAGPPRRSTMRLEFPVARPPAKDWRFLWKRPNNAVQKPPTAPCDAFGLIGPSCRELDSKTLTFFERAVPMSPNAPQAGLLLPGARRAAVRAALRRPRAAGLPSGPARPGRAHGLSVLRSKSILYGAFVCWVRRALDGQKRWFLARVGSPRLRLLHPLRAAFHRPPRGGAPDTTRLGLSGPLLDLELGY